MTQSALSKDVFDFIAQHIDSLEQLEILLLMREEPARLWSAAQMNETVRSSEASVSSRLIDLERRGFVRRDAQHPPCFQYKPTTAELDSGVTKLAAAYRERRTKVIEAVFSKPAREIRSFADAFKFRRGGEEDG